MNKIQNIKLEALLRKPNRIDEGNIKALAENIKTYGLKQPLLVIQMKDRELYEVIDGHRRFSALQLNKEKTAPCIVVEDGTDLSVILNVYRLNFAPAELYSIAVQYVKDELKGDPLALPPERIKDVSKKLNISLTDTCRILNIGNLAKDVFDLLVAGKLSLRLALLTIPIKNEKQRKSYCKRCIEERPTISGAVNFIKQSQHSPCKDLDYAVFDTSECKKCRHRGSRDKSLFEDDALVDEDYCWNITCFKKKSDETWQEQLKKAQKKFDLPRLSKCTDSWFYGKEFAKVVPEDVKRCRKCKEVKLVCRSGGEFEVLCPDHCVNIKKTRRSLETKEKVPKKKPNEYTNDEKKKILEDRFALAARKVMIEHFINYEKGVAFGKGKIPKNYKRILFFVGSFAHMNPFPPCYMRFGYSGDDKKALEFVKSLDLKKVATENLNEAARYLSTYDSSGTTPEQIDMAISLLYGEEKWCKTHYEDIVKKLSKRSKQFLVNLKKWRPSWSK